MVRRKLAGGDRPFYSTEEERELIAGRNGTWYVVRLLQGGKDWNFVDRQFVLSDSTEIKASIVHLRDECPRSPLASREVLAALRAWRGGPPARRRAHWPRSCLFAPPARRNVRFRVNVLAKNDDLPTLRADWLREIVRSVLGDVVSGDIDILENPPQQEHARTAELVLFVEW
jgi:hypothetical protein